MGRPLTALEQATGVIQNTLPEGSAERKDLPICTGALDYFPAAIAYVAHVSKFGNDKHNPGEPLHHARGKSMDHADCIVRHQMDRGGVDDQGIRHSGYVAWRALAQLQQELEDAGEAPLARGARLPDDILDRQFYTGGQFPEQEIIEAKGKRYRVVDVRVPKDGESFLSDLFPGEVFHNGVVRDHKGGVRKIVERIS